MSAVGRLLRIACATVHATCGRIAYRLGMHATARRRFERVLLLRGADFGAYVHLGRIAFDLGDYASWRRELEHARRTDPVRFARLAGPSERIEPRLAGTRFDPCTSDGFEATDARATWRGGASFLSAHRPDGGAHEGFGRGSDLPFAPGFDALHSGPRIGERAADEATPASPAGGVESSSPTMPDASLSRDDFASAAERRRFQLRRPIDRQEIARCDLDDLARRLSG